MKWDPAWTWRLLAGAAASAAVAWLVLRTEWVDVPSPRPLPEPLASDPGYLARDYLQGLGLRTRRSDDLLSLPPPGATLVLTAAHWDLIDGSAERLRGWVQAGGHLVVDDTVLDEWPDGGWFPIRRQLPTKTDELPGNGPCRVLNQRPGLAQAWGDGSGFVACLRGYAHLGSNSPPLWALDSDELGAEVLRLPVGRGRVTAFAGTLAFNGGGFAPVELSNGSDNLVRNMSNRGLVKGDNAQLLAALVDAQPGAEVWFVTRIERPALPVWLWQRGAPALLLAAVALLMALWRQGSRFGPLQQEAPPARRSLAAQIRGGADFLFRHQPSALHAMALRAVDETAAQHVPGWRRLKPAARAAALAMATGLPEARLAVALGGGTSRSEANDALAVLESARRALLARPGSHFERTR